MTLTNPDVWLPLAFMGMMGLAILIYAVLDGYDLGIGMLMALASESERDVMIASIGPFWDANETWLVLGVGILLVAFPHAHGMVLSGLYLPVAFMLTGLILRGVAFDFRAKARASHKTLWDLCFIGGSTLAALAQGYMLGRYITGLQPGGAQMAFAVLSAVCVSAAYVLIGANWLLIKTTADLQARAKRWAIITLPVMAAGLVAVSIVNPLVSDRILERWLDFPSVLLLAPLPIITVVLLLALHKTLRSLPATDYRHSSRPFFLTIGIFVLAFAGLAYSFYPYIVPGELTIWQAASATESLRVIFYGAALVLPAIAGYTFFTYHVFRGKADSLSYH